ncbi:MAG: VWA domain-containing protein [Myxococcaceae bacterium]|jgi:hypothetical protein|nr:VWA domain-containing protein [Myxococcaceae bacterium]
MLLRALTVLVLAAACGRTELLEAPPVPTPTDSQRDVTVPPDGCRVTATDVYQLTPFRRQPIDVLFVIDDSCSMEDDQAELANNFDAFFGAFRANQVDFRVAAVTSDMEDDKRSGRFVGPIITDQTPSAAEAFRRLVNVGSEGSAIERALGAARAALTEPLLGTTNRGFLRPEADLALVFLGDEDDQSNFPVSEFVAFARGLKPGGQRVSATSIVGLDGCLFPGLVRGWRLAVAATSFEQDGNLALCTTDYVNILRTTAGRLVNQRCIVGLKRPIDRTRRVRVTVNGQPSGFRSTPPDTTYPNGSIELEVCPSAGGTVNLGYDECWR